ncbi:MAG: hypothetical protein BAJATHORv1_30255 [Candidatus Thorarchaeota archaeon]|nr:MAG: hypothetical protein BAJATHORv1_30255 [Candidatus Thorarchaeota archaeon]
MISFYLSNTKCSKAQSKAELKELLTSRHIYPYLVMARKGDFRWLKPSVKSILKRNSQDDSGLQEQLTLV